MFRRVIHIMLLVLLCLSSCVSHEERVEALQTVAEADSLDSNGILFSDIVRLSHAVDALCGLTHRTEKARALYYLGRNYSVIGEDATAVDYYIEADRLEPEDARLRGRLYGNMSYICAQQEKDSLAIRLYEEASSQYLIARDTLRYAYALLDESYSYQRLQNYVVSDSIWEKALMFANNDSSFIARANTFRACSHNHQNRPESALELLKSCEFNPDKSYLYWQYALTYYNLTNIDSAAFYAEKILQISSVPAHVMDAYFFLGQKAEKDDDIKKVAYYADKRNDWEYIARTSNNQRILAVEKISDYMQKPYDRLRKIIVSAALSAIILILLSVLFLFYQRIKYRNVVKSKEIIISDKDSLINQLNQSATDDQLNRLLFSINNRIDKTDLLKSLHWKDDSQLVQDINLYMFGFATRLQYKYPNVTIDNLRLYILTILDCSHKEIATYMNKSEKSIKNTKARASQKLGTSSAELRQFLIDFISQPID